MSKMKVLFSPLGLAYGSLFTAIVRTRRDHVVMITSAQAEENIDKVANAAKALHAGFTLEHHLLDDPFTGFVQGRRLAERLAQAWAKREDCQVIVNLAGGTTVMQHCVKCLADLLNAKEIVVIDRRPPEEQRSEPLFLGEVMEVPSSGSSVV